MADEIRARSLEQRAVGSLEMLEHFATAMQDTDPGDTESRDKNRDQAIVAGLSAQAHATLALVSQIELLREQIAALTDRLAGP